MVNTLTHIGVTAWEGVLVVGDALSLSPARLDASTGVVSILSPMTTTHDSEQITPVTIGSMVMVRQGERTFYAEIVAHDGERVTGYPVRTISHIAAPVEFLTAEIVRAPR